MGLNKNAIAATFVTYDPPELGSYVLKIKGVYKDGYETDFVQSIEAMRSRPSTVSLNKETHTLSWQNPSESGFKQVQIIRFSGNDYATREVVYTGIDETYTDQNRVLGVRYTYLIRSEFEDGTSSVYVRVTQNTF